MSARRPAVGVHRLARVALAAVAVGVLVVVAHAVELGKSPRLAEVSLTGTPIAQVSSGRSGPTPWALQAGTVERGPSAGSFCTEYRVGNTASALCFDDARQVDPIVSAVVDTPSTGERVVFGVVPAAADAVRLVDGDGRVVEAPVGVDHIAPVDFFVLRIPRAGTGRADLVAVDRSGTTVADGEAVLPAS